MKKIIHIIVGLNQGGAEKILYQLATRQQHQQYDVLIISFLSGGQLQEDFHSAGIKVINLNMNKSNFMFKFFSLKKIIKNVQPDIVQTWMYHANLLGGLAAKFCKVKKIYFNIRVTPDHLTLLSRFVCVIGGLFSKIIATKVVYCGHNVLQAHKKYFYPNCNTVVIENGVDVNNFFPTTPEGKQLARAKWSVTPDTIIFGMVAGFRLEKRYDLLLQAFSIVLSRINNCKLVLCGSGLSSENPLLMSWIQKYNLPMDKIILIPGLKQPLPLYHALDVFVLSSAAEGFSNALAEAMACGLRAVVTDVGDNQLMLQGCGVVVPVHAVEGLANGMCLLAEKTAEERLLLGQKAHSVVTSQFSLKVMLDRYNTLYAN